MDDKANCGEYRRRLLLLFLLMLMLLLLGRGEVAAGQNSGTNRKRMTLSGFVKDYRQSNKSSRFLASKRRHLLDAG